MKLSSWFGPAQIQSKSRKKNRLRIGETVTFDISRDGNRVDVNGDGINVYFDVNGLTLPSEIDATFAVWAVLAIAMEQGFNIHINRPVDPQIAANAERLSQFWELWAPGRYRSIEVHGEGAWLRPPRPRLPCVQLYSGGVDATYALMKTSNPGERGYAATIFGIDFRDESDEFGFTKLISKTDPLLERFNCQRATIHTNANRKPSKLTYGFTLAASLSLLSDLFETGTIAADRTFAQDMVTFPWGTNHVINPYFNGSDFTVLSIGEDIGRTEKIAALAESKVDFSALSFCRQKEFIPNNCGVCNKCIRTKAMFLATTGAIPDIFVDRAFDERLVRRLQLAGNEQNYVFDLYVFAKKHGRLDVIPGLPDLVEHYRYLDANTSRPKPGAVR